MDRVLGLAEQFAEAGASEIGFGDTTGMCNPAYASADLRRGRSSACPGRGHRALPQHARSGSGQRVRRAPGGCPSFESSFGELGLPGAGNSTGNIATEDLVEHVPRDGVETGPRPGAVHRGRHARRSRSSAASSPATPSSPAASTGTRAVAADPHHDTGGHHEQPRRHGHRGRPGHRQGHRRGTGRSGFRVAVADLNLDGRREDRRGDHRRRRRRHRVEIDVTGPTGRVGGARRQAALGPVEVEVNNAGWDDFMPFVQTTEEFWTDPRHQLQGRTPGHQGRRARHDGPRLRAVSSTSARTPGGSVRRWRRSTRAPRAA